MEHPMRIALMAVFAFLAGGCVISETEKGPGPGDQKKDAGTESAPSSSGTTTPTK